MELESLSLTDLKNLAKEKQIEGYSKMKKAELIAALLENYENTHKDTLKEKSPEEAVEESQKEKEQNNSFELKDENDEYVEGILELLPDGFGFLRGDNYLSTNEDVYVSPIQIRRFRLNTGDKIKGIKRNPKEQGKFPALIYIGEVNGEHPEKAMKRKDFDDLIPIYPIEKLKLETSQNDYTTRIMDLMSPIGKGQRGMIVAPPKAGKTTILKKIANSITANNPEVVVIVLLIDERPEEVTDMKRSIKGDVIYSTFDEQPEHHVKVAEMVIEEPYLVVLIQQLFISQKDSLVLQEILKMQDHLQYLELL